MSGSIAPPPPPASTPPGATPPPGGAQPRGADHGYLEYDTYIERQISKTRHQVKGVEVFQAGMLLIVGALAYVFAVVVVDHWVVPDGLGLWGRWLALAGLVGGIGTYLALVLVPLLAGRVNPVYAARAIERSEPSLKNSVVNFLLLRRERQQIAPSIYDAIQQRAASDLSRVPVESVVDRSRALRITYVLLALVVVLCLYKLLSPKDPLRSMARLALPWSNLAAATRVSIYDLEPGSTQAFHGDSLSVSALVRGLRDDEPVTLYYGTRDGQVVDQPLPMTIPEGDYRHQARLPATAEGLVQDVEYYIVAGDVRSAAFTVRVLTAPSLIVDAVEYQPPNYTGLPPRRTERQGDLKALEGTRVTLRARSNVDLRGADIDFHCDGRRDLTMRVDGRQAVASFTLELGADGRPVYPSYQLLLTDQEGRPNPAPIRHTVEVLPDLRPEIELVEPVRDEVEVPINGSLAVVVRAADPDFALTSIALHFAREEEPLRIEPLFEGRHVGPLLATEVVDFSGWRRGQIAVGDVLTYWAVARDNKQPRANQAETARHRVRITPPVDEPQREQLRDEAEKTAHDAQRTAEPGADEPPDAPRDGSPEDAAADESAEGQPRDEEQTGPQDEPREGQEGEGQQGKGQQGEDQQGEGQQGAGQRGAGERGEGGEGEQDTAADGRSPAGPGDEASEAGESGEPSETGESGERAADGRSRAGDESGRVDPNENPGEAFERILRHRAQQDGERPESGEGGEGDQGTDGDKPTPRDDTAAPSDESPAADGPREGDARPQPQPADAPASDDAQGEGARTAGQGGTDRPEPSQEPGSEDAAGGDPEQSDGDSGAGTPQGDDPGTPAPQREQAPRDKDLDSQGDDPNQTPDPATSPSTSPSESDSEGGESGDRSGGGRDGGGQQANQPGTGGPGQNTASDEGSGAAPGAGDGETADQPGGETPADAASDAPMGDTRSDPGGREGDGAGQPQGAAGDAGDAGDAGSPPTGDTPPTDDAATGAGAGAGDAPSGESGGQAESSPTGGRGASSPRGGGDPSGGEPAPDATPPDDSEVPEGDEANRDYARQATDLALDYLKDQLAREEPDPSLLEDLGWSREELEAFVSRWEALRRAAGEPGPRGDAARRQLDDALENLGLTPGGTAVEGGASPDELRRLRESRRSEPPPEYLEQMRAYSRGVSKTRGKAPD